MNNFDDIKELWKEKGRDVEIPPAGEIAALAKRSRTQMIWRKIAAMLMMGATMTFIAFIGLHYDFQFTTTKIGILLTIVSVAGALVINSQMLSILLNNTNDTNDNAAYLQQLIRYRNKQRFFQTKGISVYFALLTTGIACYMYEFAVRSVSFGITVYGITLAWIAFNWVYIRPRTIRKQEKKINEMISQVESISKQLNKQ